MLKYSLKQNTTVISQQYEQAGAENFELLFNEKALKYGNAIFHKNYIISHAFGTFDI